MKRDEVEANPPGTKVIYLGFRTGLHVTIVKYLPGYRAQVKIDADGKVLDVAIMRLKVKK